MSTSSGEKNKLYRSIAEPIRTGLSWNELWRGSDNGLIYCWERGRQYVAEAPDDVAKAKRGELVPIWWRGGVRKSLKDGVIKKDGTLQYLATWQGMREQDLDIDIDGVHSLTCTRTAQVVEYCPFSQWKEGVAQDQSE